MPGVHPPFCGVTPPQATLAHGTAGTSHIPKGSRTGTNVPRNQLPQGLHTGQEATKLLMQGRWPDPSCPPHPLYGRDLVRGIWQYLGTFLTVITGRLLQVGTGDVAKHP